MMAEKGASKLILLTYFVATFNGVVMISSNDGFDGSSENPPSFLRSLRHLMSVPLDKIGGGIVLREIARDTLPRSTSIHQQERTTNEGKEFVHKENPVDDYSNMSLFGSIQNKTTTKNNDLQLKRTSRQVGQQNPAKDYNTKNKRNFDALDRSDLYNFGKNSFDETERDSLGLRNIDKRTFDEIDRSGFHNLGKKNFDEIDRAGFSSMGKRTFDEIDRSGLHNLGKKNFDEIDRAGFSNMGKRTFDKINRSHFQNLGKRDFDEIDRAGFHNFGKRNFDEIDRAGFHNLGKRYFDEIDRVGFHHLGKRNFDEIDRAGFYKLGKKDFHSQYQPELDIPLTSIFSLIKIPRKGKIDTFDVKNTEISTKKDKMGLQFNGKNLDEMDNTDNFDMGKKDFGVKDRFSFNNMPNKNFNEIDDIDGHYREKKNLHAVSFNFVDKDDKSVNTNTKPEQKNINEYREHEDEGLIEATGSTFSL